MSTEHTKWFATIGTVRGRGGWQINGQQIIHATGYNAAYDAACRYCGRGERVLTLEPINTNGDDQ